MMEIEIISQHNLMPLTELTLALWPDSSLEEELENWKSILLSEKEICYLVVKESVYIAFIHLSLRFDYVEGADSSPTAYVEGLFVKEEYRKLGIAKILMRAAEKWAMQKGCTQLASDAELNNSTSIQFHQHIGFSETNRIVCFIKELTE
jgi:aminoglycoside 6'-N-acetyltransferase I